MLRTTSRHWLHHTGFLMLCALVAVITFCRQRNYVPAALIGVLTIAEAIHVLVRALRPKRKILECYENSYNPEALMIPLDGSPVQIPADRRFNPTLFRESIADQMSFPSKDFDPVEVDAAQTSINQNLVGGPNPKTLQNPILAPRIYEEIWKPNPWFVNHAINHHTRQEMYQNGYMTLDDEEDDKDDTNNPERMFQYSCVDPRAIDPKQRGYPVYLPDKSSVCAEGSFVMQDTPTATCSADLLTDGISRIPVEWVKPEQLKETYEKLEMYPPRYGPVSSTTSIKGSNPQVSFAHTRKESFPSIDTSLGYFPENQSYHYPTNLPLPTSACLPTKDQSEYYQNIFYTPLGPDTGMTDQIIEPDATSANLGISFTQPQMEGHWIQENGHTLYQEYDPNLYSPPPAPVYQDKMPSRADIYDPRLTGYGTSYRGYVDEITGEPRFYYADVEAYTQPNYLTRNHIDFTTFAPTYGPYDPQRESFDGMATRQMANDIFLKDTLYQRNDMQERLMRKNAHREWQQRMAPIQTSNTGFQGGNRSSGMSSGNYCGPRGNCRPSATNNA